MTISDLLPIVLPESPTCCNTLLAEEKCYIVISLVLNFHFCLDTKVEQKIKPAFADAKN
jgi:hypothetical protein